MRTPHGYVVVANADAGSASEEAVRQAVDVLSGHAPTEVVVTSGPGELDDVVAALGDRVLVAVGGDGSLHAAVNALWRCDRLDATVGLVPLGTGNDFARGVGIPLDVGPAAEALVAAAPRRMDLARAGDGSVMVNVAHAGIGAEAAEAATGLKDKLGPLAYPLGALWAGATHAGWRLAVEVDGEPVRTGGDDDALLMVGVANGCCIGGGTRLAPDARPDDGLLDVVVVAATGAAARAGFAKDLREGAHGGREDVRVVRGRSVRVSGEAVRHNVDGEVGEPLTGATYDVSPGAWTLLCR
jgi:YegS/Rv2252/BmrU family lipid kinase